MKNTIRIYSLLFIAGLVTACSKKDGTPAPPTQPIPPLTLNTVQVNGVSSGFAFSNVSKIPVIRFLFSAPVNHASAGNAFSFSGSGGTNVAFASSFENNDSTVVIQPSSALQSIAKYVVTVSTALQSKATGKLSSAMTVNLTTAIDSTDKFPKISDSALLTLVEQQTFKYFWDFGHPVSGMARERNTSADVVTTGGSGFGIMATIVGVERNFISRTEALTRINTIVNFLGTKCTTYHGAFSHWINGATGATVPFSAQDNGGDIVETAYMLQGLLCARQYFNSAGSDEQSLRANVTKLFNGVDWNWYRKSSENVLYWNWSPDQGFVVNAQVKGWNEALITYVMAAASDSSSISKTVYDNGWASNGGMKNNKNFFGIPLPLGPDYGGPLFFAQYSFLGINPHGLTDAYADYWTQDTAHAKINYNYCVTNPHGYGGYSSLCWGLTASDIQGGYTASSPTNDQGYIAPTAAISSLPYTTTESMNALKFFYYKLGDKIWGQYGFTDAFNITSTWFADSYLAIDQGPEIVMIENYRSGLLWKLFMSCPEVKTGMTRLGFSSPNF